MLTLIPKIMVELLLPAGSYEKAKFAIAYGADAIYIGIPLFSMRTRENKFTVKKMKDIINYAHSLNKKVYVTTNIYFHNHKISLFLKYLDEIMACQPDALIVSDPGIIDIIREKYPKAELHLSVQVNACNWASVRFWKRQGIKRIILPRELTLTEIKEIHNKNKDIDLEFFVHGSICISYSGRCLISMYLNYRDANQGACNNACRWKYKLYKSMKPDIYEPLQGRFYVEEALRKGELFEIDENQEGTYLFNSKDLCLLEFLKDLKEAGIMSFKLEGRNKSIYYLAIVGRVYREAIDMILKNKIPDYEKLMKELKTISNRDYFPGFFKESVSQNYERSSSYFTHAFLGVVRGYESGKALIELRNKLEVGATIEFVMPYPNEIKKIKVTEMYVNGEKVKSYSAGTKNLVEIPINFDPGNYCVVRKEL